MQYTLTGFSHDMGFRVFTFESVGEDHVRTGYQVRADLALIRKYGIRVQELPLLCLAVLEQRSEGEQARAFTYTESDMSQHAAECAARDAANQKKKAPRKPVGEDVGAAWRGPRL
jgi:hypothetical protein